MGKYRIIDLPLKIVFVKRIVFILLGFFVFAELSAQTSTDSLRIKLEQKRIADSIRNAERIIAIQKRADSIQKAREILMQQRLIARDSIMRAKKLERERLQLQKKYYLDRKKARLRFIDSVQAASEKNIADRKEQQKLEKKKKKLYKDGEEGVVRTDNENKSKKDKKREIVAANGIRLGNNYYKPKVLLVPPEQNNSFVSLQYGPSFYLGDLGGGSGVGKTFAKDFDFKSNTNFYGISFSQIRNELFGLRFSLIGGDLKGSDQNTYFENTKDPSYSRYLRNLDFKTKITDITLQGELFPFKFWKYTSKLHNSFFQPYVTMGVGLFHFNPQGSHYNDTLGDYEWIELHPLRTEGQGMAEYPDRKMYKLTQFNIPVGIGFQYEISPSFRLGLEYSHRIIFTDYLDDVSTSYIDPKLYANYLQGENIYYAQQINNKSAYIDAHKAYNAGDKRGNPNNNDTYFFIAAKLTIKLNRNRPVQYVKPKIIKYDDSEICD